MGQILNLSKHVLIQFEWNMWRHGKEHKSSPLMKFS